MSNFCCEKMRSQVNFLCEIHNDLSQCPDSLITYEPRFNSYGLRVHDGGSSSISIHFCPWCGVSLPHSLRERWFNELDRLGFDDPFSQEIPSEYQSDAWYRDQA